jgi:hypothetical protein
MSAPEFKPSDGEVIVNGMYGDSRKRLLLKFVFLLLVLDLKRTENTFMQIT